MNDNKNFQQNGQRPSGQQNQRPNNQQGSSQRPTEQRAYMPRETASVSNTAVEPAGQKYVSIAIIAFLLGFGAAALWFGDNTGAKGAGTNATSTTATSTDVVYEPIETDDSEVTPWTPSVDSVTAINQKAGLTVAVSSMTLAQPAWLVVTETIDGISRYLGAQYFDKGTRTNGVIELLRGTVAGHAYDVVIRSDNGDHTFDPKLDTPLTNASGKQIASSFVALE
jgi:hypothetical protein